MSNHKPKEAQPGLTIAAVVVYPPIQNNNNNNNNNNNGEQPQRESTPYLIQPEHISNNNSNNKSEQRDETPKQKKEEESLENILGKDSHKVIHLSSANTSFITPISPFHPRNHNNNNTSLYHGSALHLSNEDLFEGDVNVLTCCGACCSKYCHSEDDNSENDSNSDVSEQNPLLDNMRDAVAYEAARRRSSESSVALVDQHSHRNNNNDNCFKKGIYKIIKQVKQDVQRFVKFLSIHNDPNDDTVLYLPRASQCFCFLTYLSASIIVLVSLYVLWKVNLTDNHHHHQHDSVQDYTVCQSFSFQNKKMDLYFTLVSFLLNTFFLIWFSLRAVKYEKSAFLFGYGVVFFLQLVRIVYFVTSVSPRYFSNNNNNNESWLSVQGLLHLSLFACVVALVVSFVIAFYLCEYSFGGRTFQQGITHPFLIALKNRHNRLQTLLQLEVALAVNVACAGIFLLDNTREHIINVFLLGVMMVGMSVVVPWLRSSSAPKRIMVSRRQSRAASLEQNTNFNETDHRHNNENTRYNYGWYPIVILFFVYVVSLSFQSFVIGANWKEYRVSLPISDDTWDSLSPGKEKVRTVALRSSCYQQDLSYCLRREEIYIVRGEDYTPDSGSGSSGSSASSSSFSSSSLSSSVSFSTNENEESVLHVHNGSSIYLPTQSLIEEYFQIKNCNATCYTANGGDAYYHDTIITDCCASYGACRQKFRFRSSTVLLLILLNVLQCLIHGLTLHVLLNRYVEDDDGAVRYLRRGSTILS